MSLYQHAWKHPATQDFSTYAMSFFSTFPWEPQPQIQLKKRTQMSVILLICFCIFAWEILTLETGVQKTPK